MSSDRLERRLPEVLTELSLPRVPDYVDNLLDRTARTPQRPGWTFPERWFPVSTFSATMSPTPFPLRLIVTAALLIALAAAALFVYTGSQHRLPPPFGLARNGVVITTDASGNVVTVDPTSGATKTVASGPGLCCAAFSPDGLRVVYLHVPVEGADPSSMTIANLDGSTIVDVPGSLLRGFIWGGWSPSGDRMLLTTGQGAVIVDAANGASTSITTPAGINSASWIGTTGDILLSVKVSDTLTGVYRLGAGQTGNAAEIATLQYAVNTPLVSPDGSKFLYFIWGPEERLQGDLHVYDLATAVDAAITEERFADSREWENPVWSPDGSKVAAELYQAGDINRIAVVPATGGEPTLLGRTFPTGANGASILFSPDGTSLLVTYHDDNSTWLLPVDGSAGREVPWASGADIEWQRLAK